MPESELSQESIEYARLQEAYGGRFVATRNGEVVASGDTHAAMVRDLKERGVQRKDLVFEYVRPKGQICVYRGPSSAGNRLRDTTNDSGRTSLAIAGP